MKTKKKSAAEQQELSPWQLKIQHQERRENLINVICLAVIAVAFLIGWEIGMVALIFGIWSWLWYEHGKYNICCDEYEVGGYPAIGVRTMIKGWFVFAALAALVYYFILA